MRNVILKCVECGKILEVIEGRVGSSSCCGKNLKKLKPNTVDASVEKHVPIIEQAEGGGILVRVGSEAHPMIPEHYIMWIEVQNADRVERQYLNPGDAPEALFHLPLKGAVAFAYCNIHGLWSTDPE